MSNLSLLFEDPVGFLRSMLLVLPAILIGLSLHEFAHAWMSDRLGDPTPRAQGRLTISPFAHVDPFGLATLFLFGFGFGKPVMIDPRHYKHRNRGEILVSLAGVTMNFLCAVVFTGIFVLVTGIPFVANTTMLSMAIFYGGLSSSMQIVAQILYNIIIINLNLMIFNLLPLPPLDGYKVVKNILLGKWQGKLINFFWFIERYGFLLIVIVLASGILDSYFAFCIDHLLSLLQTLFGWLA